MDSTPVDIAYYGFVLGHGGDAVQMLELALGMQRRGRRVRILVPEIPTTLGLAADAARHGIDLVRTPLMRADPVAPRQVPEDLAALFLANPAHLMHFHTGDFCLSRTIPRVLAELDVPRASAAVTVHSPYDTLTPGDERSTAWAAAAETRFYSIVCPSLQSVRTQHKYGVPEGRVRHIPNGVNTARYGSGDAAPIRSELGLHPKASLLVFTSRLDTQKRPLDALAAFMNIASEAEFRLVHLAFVGQGELEDTLRQRAASAGLANRVHLMGHRSDIPNWLAASTVWVLPTEAENFSLAVLEALAAGCAILSTRCRGNDEVLISGHNAELHTVANVPQITDKLRMLLRNPDYRDKLGNNGIHTSHKYDTEVMIEQYSALYTEMESELKHGR